MNAYVNGRVIRTFEAHFTTRGFGGVLAENGFNNIAEFRNFDISPIMPNSYGKYVLLNISCPKLKSFNINSIENICKYSFIYFARIHLHPTRRYWRRNCHHCWWWNKQDFKSDKRRCNVRINGQWNQYYVQ